MSAWNVFFQRHLVSNKTSFLEKKKKKQERRGRDCVHPIVCMNRTIVIDARGRIKPTRKWDSGVKKVPGINSTK